MIKAKIPLAARGVSKTFQPVTEFPEVESGGRFGRDGLLRWLEGGSLERRWLIDTSQSRERAAGNEMENEPV